MAKKKKLKMNKIEKRIMGDLIEKIGEKQLTDMAMMNLMMGIFADPFENELREELVGEGMKRLAKTKMKEMDSKDEFMTPIGVMTFTGDPKKLWPKLVDVVVENSLTEEDQKRTIAEFTFQHVYILGFLTVFEKMVKSGYLEYIADGRDPSEHLTENTAQYLLWFAKAVEEREVRDDTTDSR